MEDETTIIGLSPETKLALAELTLDQFCQGLLPVEKGIEAIYNIENLRDQIREAS